MRKIEPGDWIVGKTGYGTGVAQVKRLSESRIETFQPVVKGMRSVWIDPAKVLAVSNTEARARRAMEQIVSAEAACVMARSRANEVLRNAIARIAAEAEADGQG